MADNNIGLYSMDNRPRADATPIHPRDACQPSPNWRPWQLSPFLLVPLILISAGLATSLEALTQIGNEPYNDSELRAAWLGWYCGGDTNCISDPGIAGFSTSDMTFENTSDSKRGILRFLQPNTLPASSTFAWLYFPTLIAVVYAICWQVVDDEVKRIEPFYQASRAEGGAKGDRTIFASYISIPPVLAPLQALRWRQTAVFLSSLTYVLVGFVTPILQSQIFQLQPQTVQVGYFPQFSDRFEPLTRGGFDFEPDRNDGPIIARFSDELGSTRLADLQSAGDVRIAVYVDPAFARAQEAILWAAALSGSLLLWVTMRRRSGMMSDTRGLAALASLANTDPDFLERIATMAGGGPEVSEAEDVLRETVVHLDYAGRDDEDRVLLGETGRLQDWIAATTAATEEREGDGALWLEPRPGSIGGYRWARTLWGGLTTWGTQHVSHGFRFGPWPTEQRSDRTSKAAAWLVTAPKALGAAVLRWALGSSGAHYQVLHYSLSLSTLGNIILIILILTKGGTEKSLTSAEVAFSNTVKSTAGNNSIVFATIELLIVAIIKTLWVVVEEQTIALAPYRSLHVRPRKAWPLLGRDYAAVVPGARTFYAFKDGQLLLGCVTAISFLLEVGLVCFGITASMSQGTAYNADAIWIIHWIAFTVCILIILFIAATSRIWITGFPYMERNPDTIAAKLSYVCTSTRLLEDVRPVSLLTPKQREAHLRGIQGQYAVVQVRPGVVGLERVSDRTRG